MAEILKNTGAKLWSIVDDHDELQSNVFDQLFGTGGKSDIRLIDEAIGKINKRLDGYYFKVINDRLYICKDTESGTTSLPVSITDDNGHTALKVDGTSITIDGNGVVHGATIDDAFSLTSENAVQNKVVKAKFDEVDGKIKANETTISSHKNDQNNPHNVTKSQLNLENVEDKSSETIRSEITKENVTTALGYTPYTPNEVDNKFSTLETNIDWKEAVDTFTDIAVTYPSPEDGWTVNVKDTDYTYRYNGSEWVAISANAIPKATNSVDGLLSKEDHTNYDDAASKAHSHDNKSVLDGITSDKVTDWDNKSDFSGNYLDLNNKPTIPKGDGTTITMDEDGTLHGNASITVDSELSGTSENPVQNKVIYTEFEKKLNSDGDSKDLTTTFTSQDSTNVTQWTDVGVLQSGEKHSSMFQKISTMFKNIRYLYHMLGTADISTLGDGADIGTVTGALSKLNSDNTYGRKVYNSGTLLDIFEQELDNMNKHTDWGFIVTNEVSDLKNYFPEIKGWYIFSINSQSNETICKVYDSWAIYRSYEFVYFKSTREIVQLYYSNIIDHKNTVIWLPINIEIGILNAGQEVLDVEYNFDIPEGYQSCAICGYQLNGSGYTYCTVTAFRVSGSQIVYSVRNMSDLATGDIRLITSIMCIKNNFAG